MAAKFVEKGLKSEEVDDLVFPAIPHLFFPTTLVPGTQAEELKYGNFGCV